jgi:hypothetical protein
MEILMRSLILAASLLGGCIIHDNDRVGSDGRDGTGPSHDGEGEVSPYQLIPDVAEAGTTIIVSVQSNLDVRLGDVTGLFFFGDVEAGAMQAREDEVLVTVTIPLDAAPGSVDLLVEYEDGHGDFIDGAFTIFGEGELPEGCLPDDGGDDGDDDGGDDGPC